MKPISTAKLALLLMLFVGKAAGAAAAPIPLSGIVRSPAPSAAAPAQGQMFALGFALQTPAARSEALLADVKNLQLADPAQDAAPATALLARQAKDLRKSELRSYQEAARLLRALGAPQSLQSWAEGTVHLLTRPQIVSPEARPYVKSDPATATILATIDEAEAVKVIGDRSNASLLTWLKLSQGGAGVWAQTVGRLAAGMQASAASGQPFLLPREAVHRLRASAPPGAPLAVLRTLSALVPPGKGNLSSLIHQSDVSVPAAQIAPIAETIVDAYGAQALVSELSPPAQ